MPRVQALYPELVEDHHFPFPLVEPFLGSRGQQRPGVRLKIAHGGNTWENITGKL